MRRKEIMSHLQEITGNIAIASGANLDEAMRTRRAFNPGEAPEDPIQADIYELVREGEGERRDHRVAPERENKHTPHRLGPLARLVPHAESLGWLDRRTVAGQTRDLAATVIYDTAASPVTRSQHRAMIELVPVVSWYRRKFVRSAVANAKVVEPAA